MASLFSKLTPTGRNKSLGSNKASTKSPKKGPSSAKSRTSLSSFLAGLNLDTVADRENFEIFNREIACEEAAIYPLYDPDNADHRSDCTTSTNLSEKDNLNGRPSWTSSRLSLRGRSPQRSKSPSPGKMRSALYGLADTLRAKATYFYTDSRPTTPPLLQDTRPIAQNSAKSTRSKKSVRFRSSNSVIQSQKTGHSSPILIPQKSNASLPDVDISTSRFLSGVVACDIPETARPPETPMLAASDKEVQDCDSDDLCLGEITEKAAPDSPLRTPMPGTNMPLEDPFDDTAIFNAQARSSLEMKTAQLQASRPQSRSFLDVVHVKAFIANGEKVQKPLKNNTAEHEMQPDEDAGYISDDEGGAAIGHEASRGDLATPREMLRGLSPRSNAPVSTVTEKMPSHQHCKDFSEDALMGQGATSRADLEQFATWQRPQVQNGRQTAWQSNDNLMKVRSRDASGAYDGDIDKSASEDDVNNDYMTVRVYPKAPTTSPEKITESEEARSEKTAYGAFRVLGISTSQSSFEVPDIQFTSSVSPSVSYSERDRPCPLGETKPSIIHPTSITASTISLESSSSNDLTRWDDDRLVAAALSVQILSPDNPRPEESDKENRFDQDYRYTSLTEPVKHNISVPDKDRISQLPIIAQDLIQGTSNSPSKFSTSVTSQSPSRPTAAFECSESIEDQPFSFPTDETEYSWHARKIAEESRNRHLRTPSPSSIPLPETVVPPAGRVVFELYKVEPGEKEFGGENFPKCYSGFVKPNIARTSSIGMPIANTTIRKNSQGLLGKIVAMQKQPCNGKVGSCEISGEPQSEEDHEILSGKERADNIQKEPNASTCVDCTENPVFPEIPQQYLQTKKLITTILPKLSTGQIAIEESVPATAIHSSEICKGKESQAAVGPKTTTDSGISEGQTSIPISLFTCEQRAEHSKELINNDPTEFSNVEGLAERPNTAITDSIDLSIDDNARPKDRSSEDTLIDRTDVYRPHIDATDHDTAKMQGENHDPETSSQVVDVELVHGSNLHRNARSGPRSCSRAELHSRGCSRTRSMQTKSGTSREHSPDGVPIPYNFLTALLCTKGCHSTPASLCRSPVTCQKNSAALDGEEYACEERGRSSSPKGLSADRHPGRSASEREPCLDGISCPCASGCACESPCQCANTQSDPSHITLTKEIIGSGEGGKARSLKRVSPIAGQSGGYHHRPNRIRQRSRSPMVTKLLDATKGAVSTIERGLSR